MKRGKYVRTPEFRERQRQAWAERLREDRHMRASLAFYAVLALDRHQATRDAVLNELARECLRTAAPEGRKRWARWIDDGDELDIIRSAQDLLDRDVALAALTT